MSVPNLTFECLAKFCSTAPAGSQNAEPVHRPLATSFDRLGRWHESLQLLLGGADIGSQPPTVDQLEELDSAMDILRALSAYLDTYTEAIGRGAPTADTLAKIDSCVNNLPRL
ncbi:hypothetical protein J3F83DRAFT_754307 [Trichoderma novae-zelandiae]